MGQEDNGSVWIGDYVDLSVKNTPKENIVLSFDISRSD